MPPAKLAYRSPCKSHLLSIMEFNCNCKASTARVGKMGGKATLTSSTENGLWRASLDIQTNPSPAAHPGLASTPTPHSAAPNQDGAAGRRRPRRRRGPASALRLQACARAHQATLAARRQGTCQTPATRVQAAPPPPQASTLHNPDWTSS